MTADYTYDGLERLAIRATQNMTPSGMTQYVYDLHGHLLAESDGSGNTLTEYVWLDDMPLALVANVDTSPALYYVQVDHLNRPIMMTDVNKTVVWQADYNPFGDVNSITGSATNNLRFPGQYFLMEDGLHYNWYRNYDPTLGRYTQADPLSFVDGPSMYAYALGNPISNTDRNGLTVYICHRPADLPFPLNLFDHYWIKTDKQEAGMGADCPVPGQKCSDTPYTSTQTIKPCGTIGRAKFNLHQTDKCGRKLREFRNYSGSTDRPMECGQSVPELDLFDDQLLPLWSSDGSDRA